MFTNKSISPYGVCSSGAPKLVVWMAPELMFRVKHLIKRAPQEAQWFHRVKRHVVNGGKMVVYELTDLLIPKQYCSAKEVETTSEQWVQYTTELQAKYGAEAFTILAEARCWCHSHVDMPPAPSDTDEKTFTQHCQDGQLSATNANVEPIPEIMLIMNKKDEYYIRVWDPAYPALTFQGLEIKVEDLADLKELDKEVKEKFLPKPLPPPPAIPPSHYMDYGRGEWMGGSGKRFQSSKKSIKIPFHWLPKSVTKTDYKKLSGIIDRYIKTKDGDVEAKIIQEVKEFVASYLNKHQYWLFEDILTACLTAKTLKEAEAYISTEAVAAYCDGNATHELNIDGLVRDIGAFEFEIVAAINTVLSLEWCPRRKNPVQEMNDALTGQLKECYNAIEEWTSNRDAEPDLDSPPRQESLDLTVVPS